MNAHTDLDTGIAERAAAPEPGLSLTGAAFQELTLYGLRPGTDEPDYRPLPEPDAAETAIRQIADGVVDLISGSRLEDDAEDLLWSLVNVFHRKIARVERELDRNETEQRRLQREQDGSEINDVELQRAFVQGQSLLEQQNFYTAMRDLAAEHFQAHTGSVWMPASGSRTGSNRAHTAAVIDSRDFIAARRRQRDEALNPQGPCIAFAGGAECQDYDRIWAVLDKAHARHPGMVLMHGGNRKGAELIAAKWAEARRVPQIVFQPDWKLGKSAPFKRNDRMLAAKPIGVIVFPGNGITENLADKARRQGIPVMRGGA
jgi:hypothetical protein